MKTPTIKNRVVTTLLKFSVKWTWTGSAFSTNESGWSVLVTGSQSRVWSGIRLHKKIMLMMQLKILEVYSFFSSMPTLQTFVWKPWRISGKGLSMLAPRCIDNTIDPKQGFKPRRGDSCQGFKQKWFKAIY